MSNYLVITGGSRGIGKATISQFLEHKWRVVNISRTPCSLPGVTNLTADLSLPQELKKISEPLLAAVKGAEKICLIHNAGYQLGDTADNIDLDTLMRTLNVNVISSTVLNKILVPVMEPGSTILYLGSMLADKGVPKNASYIISKHAVLGLMRSTCQDLGEKKITTCCICPGLVNTKLLRDSMDEELINYVLQAHVVGKRLIEPEEIANVLYACASAPALNGALIPTNLGLIAS